MATYNYTAYESGYSHSSRYIKFNVSPDGGVIYPGAKITVSGQIYCAQGKLTKMGVQLASAWQQADLDPLSNGDEFPLVGKSIPKATLTTFSLTRTVSYELWKEYNEAHSSSTPDQFHLTICMWALGSGEGCTFDEYSGSMPVFNMACVDTVSPYRVDDDLVDLHPAQSMTVFGGYAVGYNQLRWTMDFEVDTETYPINGVTHTLELYIANPRRTIWTKEYHTGNGVNTLTVDLPVLDVAGEAGLTWKLTDDFGNTGLNTGRVRSFDVISYSPPAITSFMLERYADVIDEGGHTHVPADDGELVWLSLEVASESVSGLNTWDATFSAWPEGMDEPNPVQGMAIVRGLDGNLTGLDDWDLNGTGAGTLLRDEEQLAGFAPSAGANWIARITITDVLGNSATLISSDIVAADTILDVAPYGIGIGMRSKGQRNEFDPVTGDIAEIHQAVDIADDWMLRVRGPVAMNPGQLIKVVTIANAIPEQAVDSGNYVTVRTSFASMASTIGDGWVPISIAGWRGSSRYTMIHQCRIDRSTDELVTSAYNPSSSAKTFSVSVDLLCLRVVVEDEIAPTMDDVVIVAHTMILGDTVDAEISGTTLEIDDGRFNVVGSTLNIV